MTRDSIRKLFRVGAACALLLLSACGALETAQTTELDSNTNWLQTCSDESPCPGALSCLCGVCSHPCGTEAECSLLPGAECGPASCGGAGSFGGGMCVLPCATDAECSGSTVCEAGRCVAPPDSAPQSRWQWGDAPLWPEFEPCEGGPLTVDAIHGWVRDDLASVPAAGRQFQRYVSLIDAHNAGVCDEELDREREALILALNSVSTQSGLVRPAPIDPRNLVYRVDLRDYGWDRPVTVSGAVGSDGWEALMGSLGAFAIEFTGPEADAVKRETQCARPLATAGSLVHAVLSEPMYSALLGTPAEESQLYKKLGVDARANRETRVARRVGVDQSDVSSQVRLLERHPLAQRHPLSGRPGALWLALTVAETQDPFTEPFQTSSVETQVAFNLPNGLLGFALFDAQGQRRTESTVLKDLNQINLAARGGSSCVRCHGEGVLVTRGDVRPFVLENASSFDSSTVEAVKQLYAPQRELDDLVAGDRLEVALSVWELGISREAAGYASDTAKRLERGVVPHQLAAELWTSLEQLQRRDSELDPTLTRNVGREHFRRLYSEALCIALGGARNRPRRCP